MFEALYAPLPNLDAYFKRIGYEGPVEPTREVLDQLVSAHLHTVPFENLEPCYEHREVSINIEDIYDKIVVRHRGGYCFEQNALFYSVLKAVGFDCYPLLCRIMMRGDEIGPMLHRGTLVVLPEGKRFADVGFGGPSPDASLAIDSAEIQHTGAGDFRVDKLDCGEYQLRMIKGDAMLNTIRFADRPIDPVDFIVPNFYTSGNPNAHFRSDPMLNILVEDGAIALNGNVLHIHHAGQPVEEHVLSTKAELREAFEKYFGLIGIEC